MAENQAVFKNLVDNTYIYSHTDHFQQDLDNRIAFGRVNNVASRIYDINKLKSIRMELIKSIIAITLKSNIFYEDMGIIERDDVIITDKGIDIQLNGAKAFESKYLKGDQSNSTNIKDRAGKINDIMVSTSYQALVLSKLEEKSSQVGISTNIKQEAETFFRDVANSQISGSAAVNELRQVIQKGSFNAIDAVDILFATREERKKRTKTLTPIQEDLFKDFLKRFGKESLFSKVEKNKGELKKLRNEIKREISGVVFKADDVADAMLEVLIEQLGSEGIILSGKEEKAIRYIFFKELKPALSKVLKHNKDDNLISFEVKDQRLNGLILEQSVVLSVNIDNFFNQEEIRYAKIGEYIAKVVGQETNSSGQQIKNDIRVTGKSGTIYNIQAKNSFSTENYDAIHIQSKIQVETFAKQVFPNSDEEKIFEFFILNRAYLSKAGMINVPGKSPIKAPLGTVDNTDLILMIQFFLNQAIFHMLGNEVQEMIKTDPDLQRIEKTGVSFGNLFFIFRKIYLIPVSVFLFGAVNCLNQIISKTSKQNSADFLNSIGRLTYSRELSGLKNYTFTENKKHFYQKKINLFRDKKGDLKSEGGAHYPPNLVEIGAERGREMLKDAAFKGVNFSLSIQTLNQLLK